MRFTCCCFTCIIGNEKGASKEEEDPLIDDSKTQTVHRHLASAQSSYSKSFSSDIGTIKGTSVESTDGELFDPPSESKMGKDKFVKAVGVLKKYNVVSGKYNTKELQRQLSMPEKLHLIIGIKVMPKNSQVKVSAIEARGIHGALQGKEYQEVTSGSSDSETAVVIQVRTKIISTEVRGHTRKHEIQKGFSGALKMRNETIHEINMEEFAQCSIRFRLYYVLKHHRDKLLGEYLLDVSSLNLPTEYSHTTHVMLELCEPSETPVTQQSPEIILVNKGLPNLGESEITTTPKIQRQQKIRSQDSERYKYASEKSSSEDVTSIGLKSEEESKHEKISPKRSLSKAFKSIRSNVLSKDQPGKERGPPETPTPTEGSMEQVSAMEKLKQAATERSEKVEELKDSSAAMSESASKFSAMSVKLKEKYKSA